jgi:hydrogenase maturation protein HypF
MEPLTAVQAHRRLVVRGVVQGVGFRPHVARLAEELGVSGSCRNYATGLVLEVAGSVPCLDELERRLVAEAPPLALVESVHRLPGDGDPPTGAFVIERSTTSTGERTLVPPDTAPCADCLAEMSDPCDRRHRHPFITCTHCGPRLTIIEDLPYDRPATTMAGFGMCEACAREYADPADRRHHAQPVACHDCGPTLSLLAPDGSVVATGTEDALAGAIQALHSSLVLAVKGVGGYHLVCDAADPAAVRRLRERKQRPHQPFAVMARDLATAERLVTVGPARSTLLGRERPVVLLPVRPMARVASEVAPGLAELGVMLPYAPLHHLLFADLPDRSPGAPPVLVMTSGNLSGEPLCVDDVDALKRLGPIADLLLVHDRPIAVPCEDSVLAWSASGAVPVRRSRGFAPLPVPLPAADGPVVLAAGAELKNTVTLAHDGRAHVSAHVGDLASWSGREHHRLTAERLVGFHRVRPTVVAADRHPAYASRAWAVSYAAELGVPLVEVQHHHAHLASLAAEQERLDEPLLGLVLDGTGWGCDRTIWGGELLLLEDAGRTATRLGHLGTVLLPGGDEGVRNPVRVAALALLAAGRSLEGTPVGDELTVAERIFLERAHTSGIGGVVTSSAGRLFDAVASVLGVRHRVTYEAQAAVELEALATRWGRGSRQQSLGLPLPLAQRDGLLVVEPAPLVAALDEARADGVDRGALAWAFHRALGRAVADLAARAAAARGLTTVGLTGGVLVNRLLLAATTECLRDHGLEALTHRVVPPNDGGLALGQAAVAAATVTG